MKQQRAGTIPRVPALDGLRGAAILTVVVFHTASTFVSDLTHPLDRAFNMSVRVFAPSAVDLFFVISGYLITTILYQTRDAAHPLRTFYIRRALRIVPLYYAYLLFLNIAYRSLGPAYIGGPGAVFSEMLFLTNFMLVRGLETVGGMNAHFWTLAIEEQFYVVWPLIVLFARRDHLITLCCGIIVGSAVSRLSLTLDALGHVAWLITPSRLDGLAAGSLVALVQLRHPQLLALWARKSALAFLLLFAAVLGGVALRIWDTDLPIIQTFAPRVQGRTLETVLGPFAGGLFFASCVACIVQAPPDALRILKSRVLTSVARYSYGMYAFHLMAMSLAFFLQIPRRLERAALDLPYQLAAVGVTIAFSYAIGFVTWHAFEKQVLKLAPSYRFPGAGERRDEPPEARTTPAP